MVQNVNEPNRPVDRPLDRPLVTDRGIAEPQTIERHIVERTVVTHRPGYPRWGAVVAGIFSALGALALLSSLGTAIGASAYDPSQDTRAWGIGAGIWAIVIAIVSFFIGGFVAGRSADYAGPNRQYGSHGLFHGMLVWAVAVPILALLIGSGLSRLASGAAANPRTADVMSSPTATPLSPNFTQQMTQNGRNQTAADNNQSTQANRSADKDAAMKAAWGAFASLVLGLIAAILGGLAGAKALESARREVEAGTPAAQV